MELHIALTALFIYVTALLSSWIGVDFHPWRIRRTGANITQRNCRLNPHMNSMMSWLSLFVSPPSVHFLYLLILFMVVGGWSPSQHILDVRENICWTSWQTRLFFSLPPCSQHIFVLCFQSCSHLTKKTVFWTMTKPCALNFGGIPLLLLLT